MYLPKPLLLVLLVASSMLFAQQDPTENRSLTTPGRSPAAQDSPTDARIPLFPDVRLPGRTSAADDVRVVMGGASRGPTEPAIDPALLRGHPGSEDFPGEPDLGVGGALGGLGNPGGPPPPLGGGQAPVPEPSTWALFLMGLVAVAYAVFRSRAPAPVAR